jgi:hypothetical protein
MSTATFARMVRDPTSGEIHLPNETVAVRSVIRNLDRTLLKAVEVENIHRNRAMHKPLLVAILDGASQIRAGEP